MAGGGKTFKSRASKKGTSRSSKVGLQFLMGRITWFLKVGKYNECVGVGVGVGAPVYLVVVLKYLAAKV